MNRRLFVEKKERFRVEAQSLLAEFNENLSLDMKSLRLVNVYDLFGFSDALVDKCRYSVFGEVVTDTVSDSLDLTGKKYLAVEYIPGQFDQRASSAVDCVHLIDPDADVEIRSSRLLIFDDDLPDDSQEAIKHYFINAVESREKDLSRLQAPGKADVRPMENLEGFTALQESGLDGFCKTHGLAMNADDLREIVNYFQKEGRNPTETELRILDTYWSDHCRHTTFNTELQEVKVEDSFIKPAVEASLEQFDTVRAELGRSGKRFCLMEIATIGARYLRSKGKLDDLEVSGENNACSVFVDVDTPSGTEKWLLQFKNETHNHPTEIEPFGGASTCLGGAIRDPLSGRAYVYQAMRVTGAGDINAAVKDTLPGKLPQRVISRKAAAGYSSYGNQIGLATTHVREIYHEGYTAKRLEVGAVVGAVRAADVRREEPVPGDVVLLLGGRTGRDGIGGATGSSKSHTGTSLETAGSEVQKGNAPEERKLQRLFRRPEVTRLIKRSNDFGAGGVSVAIGELADGLDIYLDRVPAKYAGLNATELAISESQERMAVVVAAADREEFERLAAADNLEITYVADVTDSGRMRMWSCDALVADLSRAFIDSTGAPHYARATVQAVEDKDPFARHPEGAGIKERMGSLMKDPNVASQQGLVEMFDATIGRSTVLMPYGGLMQATETQVSVQKLPVEGTDTASMMAFGFNPELSSWSPYHGAAYAVVEACAKLVAAGGEWSGMRFSYQEYFEKMKDERCWGKPLAALLGALRMQLELGLPSIGGKDSMSGSFEDLKVPPTLIAFGINTVRASKVISPEFKWDGNRIYLLRHTPLADRMPDTECLKSCWDFVHSKIESGDIVSAWAVGFGGVGEALVKMSFGNRFGAKVKIDEEELYRLSYGSIVVESSVPLEHPCAELLGEVLEEDVLIINGIRMPLDDLQSAYEGRYAKVYPETVEPASRSLIPDSDPLIPDSDPLIPDPDPLIPDTDPGPPGHPCSFTPCPRPLVYIPVFPGTNCDYDTAAAFRAAGAEVRSGVFRNLTAADVRASISEMASAIDSCHILALAGGFSSGDEPDGSGKFIASVLCNAEIARSVEGLLARGGLILGICNGFQALVKSGLLPYGLYGMLDESSPTLFRNDINRHVSRMVTTRVASTASPWLRGFKTGDLHTIAVSHGEGKFVVSAELARRLFENGQVAFQYADLVSGEATMEPPYNPNGSCYAIEGILSPEGQILGKMGHSERFAKGLFKNIDEDLRQPLFENAVNYFKQKR